MKKRNLAQGIQPILTEQVANDWGQSIQLVRNPDVRGLHLNVYLANFNAIVLASLWNFLWVGMRSRASVEFNCAVGYAKSVRAPAPRANVTDPQERGLAFGHFEDSTWSQTDRQTSSSRPDDPGDPAHFWRR